MASIFTKIIRGELPGRFLWRDERAVALLTIEPIRPGHALVVPVQEVEHWLELEPELAAHLMVVAQAVGRAQMKVFSPRRVGMMIVGIDVPHVHLHTVPMDGLAALDFSRANRSPKSEDMDDAAERIRAALAELGHEHGA